MAGEEHIGEVVAYLARLTGSAPSLDEPLKVRSVHRAALAAWARKQNVPLRLAAIGSGAPFTVRDLLGGDLPGAVPGPAEHHGPVASPLTSRVTSQVAGVALASAAFSGIGIDIEDVDNLPIAADYREHPFFRDNFNPAEIAYCLRQADTRASFCGIWAAKEAILKAGAGEATEGRLISIEVGRDDLGRPSYKQCQLSISHTPKTAVAICMSAATHSISSSHPAPPPSETAHRKAAQGGGRWPWSRRKA